MKLGTVYVEVAGAELPRLVEFYRDRLGLALAQEEPGHSAWFDAGPVRVGFHGAEDSHVDPGVVNLSFDVDDVDVVVDRLREEGIEIVQGPMDAPWGPFRVAVLFDPVGHTVWLSAPA